MCQVVSWVGWGGVGWGGVGWGGVGWGGVGWGGVGWGGVGRLPWHCKRVRTSVAGWQGACISHGMTGTYVRCMPWLAVQVEL
jgi:hypothetical protein